MYKTRIDKFLRLVLVVAIACSGLFTGRTVQAAPHAQEGKWVVVHVTHVDFANLSLSRFDRQIEFQLVMTTKPAAGEDGVERFAAYTYPEGYFYSVPADGTDEFPRTVYIESGGVAVPVSGNKTTAEVNVAIVDVNDIDAITAFATQWAGSELVGDVIESYTKNFGRTVLTKVMKFLATYGVTEALNSFFNDVALVHKKIVVDISTDANKYTKSEPFTLEDGKGNVTIHYSVAIVDRPPVGLTAADPGAELSGTVLFDDDPANNLRNVNATFCSGFESECEFGNCPQGHRIVWGPYCRESNNAAIQHGTYKVTLHGTGNVVAGATDYGIAGELYRFKRHNLPLPGSYIFCWRGRGANGYGFETIVQSTGTSSSVDRITIEYLGSTCRAP